MKYLHACDPGFDEITVAIYDLEAYHRLEATAFRNTIHPHAMLAFVRTLRVTSDPKDSLGVRCSRLAAGLRSALLSHPPAALILEVPTNLVPHAGKTRTSSSMGKLGLAVGVTIGVLDGMGLGWQEWEADRAPKGYEGGVKAWRRDHLHRLCSAVGSPCERSQDVIDAQWLGVRALAADVGRV